MKFKNRPILNNKWAIIIGCILTVAIIVGAADFTKVLYRDDAAADGIKQAEHEKITVEGDFVDRNGAVIMNPTEVNVKNSTYVDLAYSYILGYNHPSLGKSGLRKIYRDHLYDDNDTKKGGTVQLTIDDFMQKKAHSLLKNNNLAGSVIVLDVKTGELLVLASRRKADYDLNGFNNEKYDAYKEVGDARGRKNMFSNPATADMDAPGSVYKVVTSCAAIDNGLQDFVYTDTGLLEVGGAKIRNAFSNPKGEQNLPQALATSTNTYFASLSLALGEKAMKDTAEKFLIGQNINLGFATLKSQIEFDGRESNLAMIGFGQGALAVSPLHLAMIGQSIVNDGTMVEPVLVKALHSTDGRIVFEDNGRKFLAQNLGIDTAVKVKGMMRGVTEHNFPRFFDYAPNVYCKTGTADLDDKRNINHAYLLCATDDYVILASVNDTQLFGANLDILVEPILKDLYAK